MNLVFKLLFILPLTSLMLVSCVGTIEDTKTDTGRAETLKIGQLVFPGITSATAISHNKVEITFPPAGGSVGDVTYLIKYDGLDEPITAIEKSLFRNSFTGQYKYTVTGLTPFTTYSFNVTCVDDDSNAEGNNTNVQKATTFLQPTANFGGVGLVTNVQGLAGLNSLKVEWVKAPLYVDFGTPDPRDVANYEVTVLSADFTPESMNDSSVPTSKRRVLLVDKTDREVVVGGLAPGKEYHVQVRAINYGHINNFTTDPTFRHEENTKFVSASTLTLGVGDISFDEDSFLVLPIDAEGGLSSVNASWTAANGAFNHYRLVYEASPTNESVDETFGINSQFVLGNATFGGSDCANALALKDGTDPFQEECKCEHRDTHNNDPDNIGTDGEDDLFCLELDFDKESQLVANLNSYTNYDFVLLVCADVNCYNYTRSKTKFNVKTQPQIAAHEFETAMRGPSSAANLDYLYIDLKALPDYLTGVIDGFEITIEDENGNEVILGDPNIPDNELAEAPPIRMLNYDPKNDTSIVLTGYNLATQPIYNITLIPFQYDGNVMIKNASLKKEYNNVSFVPLAPGDYDGVNKFEGATGCNDIGSNTGNYKMQWDLPLDNIGVYSHFQLYLQEKASPTDLEMDFATAITYPTLPLIDGNQNEFTIEGLDPAKNYIVSVRTYYNNGGTIIRNPIVDSQVVSCD